MSDNTQEIESTKENQFNKSHIDEAEHLRTFINNFTKFKDNFFRTPDNHSSYYTYPKQVTGLRGENSDNYVVGSGNGGSAGA